MAGPPSEGCCGISRRLPRETQRSPRRSQYERPVRKRDRALAAQDFGVCALELHRRTRRARARQRRSGRQSLTRQRERSPADIAVRLSRETALSECQCVAGAGRRGLLGLTGRLHRLQIPGAAQLFRSNRRRSGNRRRRRRGRPVSAPTSQRRKSEYSNTPARILHSLRSSYHQMRKASEEWLTRRPQALELPKMQVFTVTQLFMDEFDRVGDRWDPVSC